MQLCRSEKSSLAAFRRVRRWAGISAGARCAMVPSMAHQRDEVKHAARRAKAEWEREERRPKHLAPLLWGTKRHFIRLQQGVPVGFPVKVLDDSPAAAFAKLSSQRF